MHPVPFAIRSRGSSVDIVTRLRAGSSGFRIPVGAKDFYLPIRFRPALGPSMGTAVLSER